MARNFRFTPRRACGKLLRMSSTNRVVKPKLPARVVLSAVAIGLLVVGFIVFAVWQSGHGITQARMSGMIVSKEFQPLDQPEREITLNRSGALSATNSTGNFIITVEVPQPDGTKKLYTVWLNDKARYDAVKVGDSFDVGPYYLPEKAAP